MSSRQRYRTSIRRTVSVALAAALALGAAQPMAYADVAVDRAADPDPQFLAPADEPRNSVVHPDAQPAPEAPSAPADPDRASAEKTWLTHADSRREHADAAALAKVSGKRVLVTGKMTEDATTYANPDGTTTTEITSGPNRGRRGDGWADVDTTLVKRGNRYEAAAVVGRLSLSAGGLDAWKRRDRNAYWDAVYRDCDQHKEAGVSPGALYCEQAFRVAIGLGAHLPHEDFAHSPLGVILGLDDISDCASDGKISACIFAAASLLPSGWARKLAKLDELGAIARISDDILAAEKHLETIDGALDYGPNKAMLDSIRDAVKTGRPLTAAERNFLDHELLEATLVKQGMSLEDAHNAVYRVIPPGANYSPEVVEQFSDHFSPAIRNYWKQQG